ncbi:MAG: hypothetical protein G8D89_22315 [gamma proteobacterium symbiont of Clathrolucina costata]
MMAVEKLRSCRKIDIPDPLIKALFCTQGWRDIKEYRGAKIHPMDGSYYNQSFSRIYLTYLTQRLFDFQRLPGFEEEVLYSRDDCVKDALASLTEDEIQEHLAVLEELYAHTQKELKKALDSDTIRLYRGFKEPMNTMVSLAVRYAKEQGERVARVYGNTLDFFAVSHEGHSAGASISVEVPIKDILLSHQTVLGFSGTDQDIFVINRSPTGFFDLPLECFETEEVCEVAWQDFSRIAGHARDRDHRLIFSNMFRNIPPREHLQYEFKYEPGYFETLLGRLGKRLDVRLYGRERWYRWQQKSYKQHGNTHRG